MKKIKYLTLLFILFLCIIGYIFLNNPFFNISNVIVKGNDLLTRDDIISYSNVKIGTNIFKTNSKDIYKNLMRNPRIKEADMKRVLPSTLLITVAEREDFAALYYLGAFIKIDKKGTVLAVKKELGNVTVPIITGLEIEKHTLNEKIKLSDNYQLDTILNIVYLMDKYELKDLISEINMEDLNDMKFYFVKGIEARIGKNDDIEEKIYLLKSIIIDIIKNERGQGYIELRGTKDPIFYPITE